MLRRRDANTSPDAFFARVCDAVADDVAQAVRTLLEVVMIAVLLCGLAGAVAMIVRDVQATRHALEQLDPASVLTTADKIIDGKLDERLRDGTILLVCTRWLLSSAADAALVGA